MHERLYELIRRCGDAFYLLDIARFRENYARLKAAFDSVYPYTQIAYSYKTNYAPALARTILSLGGYAELTSSVEYAVAKGAGVPESKMILNGPAKDFDTARAVLRGGGLLNMDAADELPMLEAIACDQKNWKLRIGIRCNLGAENGVVSRFGVDVHSPEFDALLRYIHAHPAFELTALHVHGASRSLESWRRRVQGMLCVVREKCAAPIEMINLGGGLYGSMPPVLEEQFEHVPTFEDYAACVGESFRTAFPGEKERPLLMLEPGTALVADTMRFVTRVVSVKRMAGCTYVTVQGSVYQINPTGGGVNLPVWVLPGENHSKHAHERVIICGNTCMERDILWQGGNVAVATGDYLVFEQVGSYTNVLKPPFGEPNVPILAVNAAEDVAVVKRRETALDILQTYCQEECFI